MKRNVTMFFRIPIPICISLLLGFSSCHTNRTTRIELKLNDKVSGSGFLITFNDTLSRISPDLMLYEGKTSHGLKAGMKKAPEKDTLFHVWVDTDRVDLLTDESPFDISPEGESPRIYVASPIQGDSRKLPFTIFLSSSESGYNFYWSTHYSYEGMIRIQDDSLKLRLLDINCDGLINTTDARQGTNIVFYLPDTAKYPYGRWCRSSELIPLGDQNFKIDSLSVRGDFVSFQKTDIPVARVDRTSPDFTFPGLSGNSYQKKDYKGQWLLLDFWFTGCAPCLRTFPDLVKFYDANKGHLRVLGVCVEKESRKKLAEEIIAKYKLDWDHAFIGEDSDFWLSFGGINDNHLFFPLYVLISPDGIIRYGGPAREGFAVLDTIIGNAY